MGMSNDRFYLGADPNNPCRRFWLDMHERRAHVAIVGATGTGKSHLLVDLIGQDVASGRGCGLVDAKGDTADAALAAMAAMPEEKWPTLVPDLVIIDPADPNCRAFFNPLEVRPYGSPSRQCQDMVSVIKKVFGVDDTQAPRLGLVLRRSLQLAMDHQLTLCDVPRILTDGEFRGRLVQRSEDEALRRFWEFEFPDTPSAQAAWTASSLVRLETLLDDPAIRRFLGQPRSSFDFRRLMDEGKVAIISLSKGRLGQESAYLLGGFLMVALQLAAESRQEIFPPEARRPWYLYIDEAQNYVNTRAFQELLTEARGYGLALTLANQHLAQLEEGFRKAILGNVRIRVAFRIGSDDAAVLSQDFWRFQGDRVKETRWDTVRLGRGVYLPFPEPVYFSPSDEVRQNREALHYLPDRLMWVHLASRPAPYLLRTVEIPRDRLAAARGKVPRLKELVAEAHGAPALSTGQRAELPSPQRQTYEWVRSSPSERVRAQS
jgi:hypothetical protein